MSGRVQFEICYHSDREELIVSLLAADNLPLRDEKSGHGKLPETFAKVRILPKTYVTALSLTLLTLPPPPPHTHTHTIRTHAPTSLAHTLSIIMVETLHHPRIQKLNHDTWLYLFWNFYVCILYLSFKRSTHTHTDTHSDHLRYNHTVNLTLHIVSYNCFSLCSILST